MSGAEEHLQALPVSAPQTSAAFPPPPALGPRPAAFMPSSILNPGLSEEFPRRPLRPAVPSLLKDAAFKTVMERMAQSDREMELGVEDAAKAMLNDLMNEFLTDVGSEAVHLAKRRKANVVNGRDLGLVLNKRYGLNVAGGNGGAVVPVQQGGSAGNEDNKRMAAVRKMSMQVNRQHYR